jgi:hypothetical protein
VPTSGQKLTLGLDATIAFEAVTFGANAPFPALLQFLNASWKLCSVRVLSTAFESATVTSTVKMAAFQFYLQSGKH